jgi:hypothetical protein
MSEAAERPSVIMPFRWLMAIALGLALLAFIGGRQIYTRYGGYRPLALVHVPSSMRYRARVDMGDRARLAKLAPLLRALDPRAKRWATLAERLGSSKGSSPRLLHELAFGVGPAASDFVVVFGLQLQAGAGLPAAKAACASLNDDGIHSQPSAIGCRLDDGSVLGGAPDGALVLASREELVKDLLTMPDIGDRLGFSGPSVRGAAPEPEELGREAAGLAATIAAKYP